MVRARSRYSTSWFILSSSPVVGSQSLTISMNNMITISVMSAGSIVAISRTIAFTAVFTLSIPAAMGKATLSVYLTVCVFTVCLSLRLKPLDIQFMKELHHLVNIIPVIAKADTLTPSEIRRLKTRVCSMSKCTSE